VIVYLETTSALVKLAIAEPGSEDSGALGDAAGRCDDQQAVLCRSARRPCPRSAVGPSVPRHDSRMRKRPSTLAFGRSMWVEVTLGHRVEPPVTWPNATHSGDATVHLASLLTIDSPDLVLAT